MELLDSFSHHLKRLLGDGAYNDAALESYLAQYRSLQLLAPAKGNQPPKRSQPAQRQLNRLRLICETVNAQLQEQLHLSKHYAQCVKVRFSPHDRSARHLFRALVQIFGPLGITIMWDDA